ncbi:MAG: hypothetical protein HYZ36_01250 [Pedosphaera parvula]|nr:hypothetical protein [Pedosphaera parvula]
MPDLTAIATRVPTVGDALVFPLNELYARAGLPLPRIELISGDSMPEPYRSLLVHHNDMTPTLETFYHSDIHLEIISRHQGGEAYSREVVLRLEQSETAVEFGANKIHLARFPSEARELILGEHVPLGRILKDCAVSHRTAARAFLRVECDSVMADAFNLREPTVLYGRKAVICNLQAQPLSEIVEILPPAGRIETGC